MEYQVFNIFHIKFYSNFHVIFHGLYCFLVNLFIIEKRRVFILFDLICTEQERWKSDIAVYIDAPL